jgi:hypothetical protein
MLHPAISAVDHFERSHIKISQLPFGGDVAQRLERSSYCLAGYYVDGLSFNSGPSRSFVVEFFLSTSLQGFNCMFLEEMFTLTRHILYLVNYERYSVFLRGTLQVLPVTLEYGVDGRINATFGALGQAILTACMHESDTKSVMTL